MTATRMNNGKPELGYILEFPTAVEAFARVKMLGAAKYERGNWKKGGKPDNEYLDACLRHMIAFANGEKFAGDSGCHHLAHAAWNLFALLDLNYPCETHDAELFDKMIEYWEQKRRAKEMAERLNRPTATFEIKDAELFDKTIEYWEQKRRAKERAERLNRPTATFEIKDAEKLPSFNTLEELYNEPHHTSEIDPERFM